MEENEKRKITTSQDKLPLLCKLEKVSDPSYDAQQKNI